MSLISGSIDHVSIHEWESNEQLGIPHELFEHILSCLNLNDLHSTIVVSRLWKVVTLDCARMQRNMYVKEVVVFFNTKLNASYAEQSSKLLKIVEFHQENFPENLTDVECDVNKLEYHVAGTLKDLKKDDLAVIFDKKIISINKNKDAIYGVFRLIVDLKKIDIINTSGVVEPTKSQLLKNNIDDLIDEGKFECAVEVAKAISDSALRIEAFDKITHTLCKAVDKMVQGGQCIRAARVAEQLKNIPHETPVSSSVRCYENCVLLELVQALRQAGQFNRAIECTHLLHKDLQASVLICLAEGSDIDPVALVRPLETEE